MFGLRSTIAIAASVAILLTILITLIVRRCNNFSKRGTKVTTESPTTPAPLTPPENRAKTELRRPQRISKIETRPRSNQPVFRRGSSAKPLFSWSDHPSLVSDAVENGWSRFAFTPNVSSQPSRSTLLGCVGDLHHHHHNQQIYRDTQMEITWEVRENSLDFMQKIRLNSGLKKFSSSHSSSMAMKSVVRTILPLPGPPLGSTSSFPEEAYFEITILSVSSSSSSSSSSRIDKNRIEGEKTKLIQEQKRNLDSIMYIATSKSTNHSSSSTSKEGERTALMMSVGLTSSSHVPLKIPGSYPASVGFNSDGSVYLDGIKLAVRSEKESWGQHKVIGCGFNPKQKKVFFTTDSVLTHMISCKSDEFGSPLYPIIAANADITILVNMGQSRFSYEPANSTRTPNPCFVGSFLSTRMNNTSYEDSEELFSMGRVDSGWLNHSHTKSSTNSDVYSWCNGGYNYNSGNNEEFKSKLNEEEEEEESEADLFEIVLDVKMASPPKYSKP